MENAKQILHQIKENIEFVDWKKETILHLFTIYKIWKNLETHINITN